MRPGQLDCVLPNSAAQVLGRLQHQHPRGPRRHNGLVPFWPLLLEVLKQPVQEPPQLIDVLETISNSLRGSSGVAGDYGTLRAVVQDESTDCRLALKMPEHLGNGHVPILTLGQRLRLSRDQAGCLVAHRFICTLQPPLWRNESFDCSIWYDSPQRHGAIEMYLVALFTDIDELDEKEAAEPLEGASTHLGKRRCLCLGREEASLAPVKIVNLDKYSTEQQEPGYQCPSRAVVVSANKDNGFGQWATQV
ncbi:Uncharacterized protein TPAR_01401 [Tolypocladium paradoxum]|uniref:Uncharacterized protein n=1 Tax=Tolypocladium paradoxum TaxID=94208 RepID=A0A2S4L7J7_9HYPO|nr:Uncharacterized protein TPAR_01401 [Tolypocladium paradoxum]